MLYYVGREGCMHACMYVCLFCNVLLCYVLIVMYLAIYVCYYITLWLFNIAMGNDPFIDGLPICIVCILYLVL